MASEAERTLDQRSLYTQHLIKGALLELLKTHSFTSISVTMLSDKAGVGRNTFYRHFSNTFDALESAIDDAIEEMITLFKYAGIKSRDGINSYVVPFCEYIRNSERYRIIFTDEDLESIIIERFLASGNRQFVTALEAAHGFTSKQAEAIARFQTAGLLETCRAYSTAPDIEWASILSALDSAMSRQRYTANKPVVSA